MHMTRTLIGWGVALVLILGLAIFGLNYCKMYTYVGRFDVYPPPESGKPTKYLVSVQTNGEKGRAFVDDTTKRVHLSVKTDAGRRVLLRTYEVKAARLEYVTNWRDESAFSVVFFDSGEGNTTPRKPEDAVGLRHIFSVRFRYDESKQEFVEAPLDAESLKLVKDMLRGWNAPRDASTKQ